MPVRLSGFGFDPYIAETPGNVVLALARFWADNAAMVVAVEERFPEQCRRVRYEDLVADPEQTAARIFSFLEASPAPGISTACFSSERERFGPGDYKTWRTSQITDDSVGRGWTVPAAMIASPVLAVVNELAARWGPHAAESFVAVAVPGRNAVGTEYWLVDLKAGTVTPASQEAQEKSGWDIVGTADAWERVIARDLNLNVALRSCQLRYCDETDAGSVAAETRLDILACLLGVGTW